MGIYAELRGFVLTHRECAGPGHFDVGAPTVKGYRVSVICGCGAEFKRWVILDDTDEDLLRSALRAFQRLGGDFARPRPSSPRSTAGPQLFKPSSARRRIDKSKP